MPGDPLVWIGRILLAVGIVAFSVLAGGQLLNPNERIIQIVVAGAVVFLAFRATSISALAFAVLLLPFPKATSYGNTNVAFVMLIFLVWIYRVSTKRESPPIRTSLDIPILGLVMAYCVSFYEVQPEHFAIAWALFLNFLSYVLVLYLVVNIIKTGADLSHVLTMQTISCVIVCLFALYEQGHPGATLIPGWISFSETVGGHGSGVRVGSTFLDYELFGEYCALNLFLQLFQWTRATSNSRRWVLVGIMLLTFFCLFSTVTRGAILSFMVGSVYLMWLSRRRLNFPRLVGAVALVAGLVLGADFVVSNFTNSDSVLDRLFTTKLENGVPDTRAGVWKQSFSNILKKPIIGHGPYMAPRIGVEVQYWPHNVYLFYAYIVGFVGLAFYLWFLWQLWRATRPRTLSLGEGSFSAGTTLLARVMLFTFIIDQIKIDYLRNARYSFFIWLLFGILWAIGRVARDEAAAERTTHRPGDAPGRLPESRPVRIGAVATRPAIHRVAITPAVPRP